MNKIMNNLSKSFKFFFFCFQLNSTKLAVEMTKKKTTATQFRRWRFGLLAQTCQMVVTLQKALIQENKSSLELYKLVSFV